MFTPRDELMGSDATVNVVAIARSAGSDRWNGVQRGFARRTATRDDVARDVVDRCSAVKSRSIAFDHAFA